jgi:hypothetical protein
MVTPTKDKWLPCIEHMNKLCNAVHNGGRFHNKIADTSMLDKIAITPAYGLLHYGAAEKLLLTENPTIDLDNTIYRPGRVANTLLKRMDKAGKVDGPVISVAISPSSFYGQIKEVEFSGGGYYYHIQVQWSGEIPCGTKKDYGFTVDAKFPGKLHEALQKVPPSRLSWAGGKATTYWGNYLFTVQGSSITFSSSKLGLTKIRGEMITV